MGLIPPFFLDCVVAIGFSGNNNQWNCIGSGFLYGYVVGKNEKSESLYRVYIATNQHVLEGYKQVSVRFNPQNINSPAHEYTLDLFQGEQQLWMVHPNSQIDIAVVPININVLKEHVIQFAFFRNDQDVADINELTNIGATEGDFLYVLGFPMNLVGGQRNMVIARNGTIARIRDMLNRTNQEYLIDAFVFPGNSGGPVISKPEAMAIHGTKSQNRALLIGIVKSYVPYQDVAISAQTKRPRVIFEENSGLATVHPIDYVNETIVNHLKSLKIENNPTQTLP